MPAIEELIPSGISFRSDPVYEDKCRAALAIVEHLPSIDGWKVKLAFLDLDEIAQTRFDLREIMDPMAEIGFEGSLQEPSRQLREYRFRFNRKRRALVRHAMILAIDQIDKLIHQARPMVRAIDHHDKISEAILAPLRTHYREITTLMGSSVPRPYRWSDMGRHLHFGLVADFNDIEEIDWPAAKESLRKSIYSEDDALPVKVADLDELLAARPSGPIPIKLKWQNLTDEAFERLIFALIADEPGYENPEWLTQTRAADRGRDLSVTRVAKDGLSGHLRSRIIIQCKHWLERSVGPADVALLKEQMPSWEPPRVDVLIIATSGRFTSDAVTMIEKHSQSDRALRIEMWPESHLEILLARRPALIAEFGLR